MVILLPLIDSSLTIQSGLVEQPSFQLVSPRPRDPIQLLPNPIPSPANFSTLPVVPGILTAPYRRRERLPTVMRRSQLPAPHGRYLKAVGLLPLRFYPHFHR